MQFQEESSSHFGNCSRGKRAALEVRREGSSSKYLEPDAREVAQSVAD